MRQVVETLQVETGRAGLHDITGRVAERVTASGTATGLLTVWMRHTSASLLVQADADPEVIADIEAFFVRLVPEGAGLYRHEDGEPDNMPAHIRAALTLTSVSIPVADGRPVLGQFQTLYVFEHRRGSPRREIVLHLIGD